ncbi:DUF6099 family protein [Streptomyces atacamensis]|uniref:DUF6099 family protein n=1 Tax=Streptomyces atacamensis TaxID=531966 RepID=UPI00399C6376
MDAVPLIEITRRALAHSEEAADVVTEAWQAQALAEAVGVHLAMTGPPEVRAQAGGLREASGRACGSLRGPGQRSDGARAAHLTEMSDPLSALHELGDLLGEAGGALVRVAVDAEEEGLYWRCIEGIDAADECGDRVAAILRRLALRPRPGPWTRMPCRCARTACRYGRARSEGAGWRTWICASSPNPSRAPPTTPSSRSPRPPRTWASTPSSAPTTT